MTPLHFRALLLASAGMIGLAATGQASAQSQAPAASGDTALEEIVVTAEKRSGSASRIGLSITAIGGEALERQRISDTRDLVKLVPGFTAAQSITNTPIYTLRGIGFNTPNLSSTSPVGVYVDETAYAFPYMTQQTAFDLERVEVLKGPQGTLYGRNTTGGLIKFVTAKPTDTFEGGVTLGYGSYQTGTAQGFVSGPLTETLSGRLAFSAESSVKGWQKSVTRDERLGEKDKKAVRGILAWKPTDNFDATLRLNYWRDRSDTQAPQAILYSPETAGFGLPLSRITPSLLTNNANNTQADWAPATYPGAKATTGQRPASKSDGEFYSAALDVAWVLNSGVTLNASSAYNYARRHDVNDVNGAPIEALSYEPRGRIRSYSQEVRLSNATPKLSWTLGGYVSRDEIFEGQVAWLDDFSTVRLIRALGGTIPNAYTPTQIAEGLRVDDAVADITTTSSSVFGSLQPQLTETLKLTIGARYTRDNTRYAGCTRDVGNNTSPVWNVVVAGAIAGLANPNLGPGDCITFLPGFTGFSGLVRDHLKEDNLSWRLGLDWTPSGATLVYGSVSRGFKSGGFPIVAANVSSQLAPFGQEKVTAFEVGAKARPFNGVRANVAAFYNDYRDKQVYTVVADPIFRTLERTQNVPKSEIYGAEADLQFRLSSALTARTAITYTKTRVKTYLGFDQDGVAQDFRGDSFPYSPEWQATAGLDHTVSLANGMSLRSSANVSYQSRSHADFRDYARYNIKAYALVDGRVSLVAPDKRWTGALWVKNLFDTDYWTSVNYGRDMYVRYAGMPRTFGASISLRFE